MTSNIAEKFRLAVFVLVVIVGAALFAFGCNDPAPATCAWLKPGLHGLSAKLVAGEPDCAQAVSFVSYFDEHGVERPEEDVCSTGVAVNEKTCSVQAHTTCPGGFDLYYDLRVEGGKLRGTIEVVQDGSCKFEVVYTSLETPGR